MVPSRKPSTTAARPPTSATSPTPSSAKVSQRRLQTQQRLLTAASEAFAERGFFGTNVEDICDRAGFTRGAFYSNFSSLDEIVVAINKKHVDKLHNHIRELMQSRPEPDQLIEMAMTAWNAEGDDYVRWRLLNAEFTLYALRNPKARSLWASARQKVRDELVQLIDDWAKEVQLSLIIDTESFVHLLEIVIRGSTEHELLQPRTVRATHLQDCFVKLAKQGAQRAAGSSQNKRSSKKNQQADSRSNNNATRATTTTRKVFHNA